MAVNGIELQVGQVWRVANGVSTGPLALNHGDADYPFWDRVNHATYTNDGRRFLDDTDPEDVLVELLSGPGFVEPVPEGFTPWAGGEQPAETVGKRVHAHFRNTTATADAEQADDFSWKNTNSEDDIVAYKVAELEDLPRPGVIDDYTKPDTREYTGGKVNYYEVAIKCPTREGRAPYTAECNDIIEALGMTFAEGEAFKANWRGAAARKNLSKRGYTDGLYDAEKVVFYGQRMVVQQKGGV